MAFISATAEQKKSEAALHMNEQESAAWGFVPHFAETYHIRPEVYAAWKALNGAIKKTMDPRRYEVATVAAAAALRSSYCTLAHGRILASEHMSPTEVTALVHDAQGAALDPADRAVAVFAREIVLHADRITEQDVAELRAHGLSDTEIFDVVLAASARCFFSKSLDATGTLPDTAFLGIEPAFRKALTVGRPIAIDADEG